MSGQRMSRARRRTLALLDELAAEFRELLYPNFTGAWLREFVGIRSPSRDAMALGTAMHEAFERVLRWPFACSPNDGSVWFEREEPAPHRVLLWGPCSPRMTTRHGTRRRRATRAGDTFAAGVLDAHNRTRTNPPENLFTCARHHVWFEMNYCSLNARESIHEGSKDGSTP